MFSVLCSRSPKTLVHTPSYTSFFSASWALILLTMNLKSSVVFIASSLFPVYGTSLSLRLILTGQFFNVFN